MKHQNVTTRSRKIFSRAIRRLLIGGVVLLLLITNQSLAGVVCLCDHHSGSRHECHEAAQISDSTVSPDQCEVNHRSSPPCPEESASTPATKSHSSLERTEVCCYSKEPVNAEDLTAQRQNNTETVSEIQPLPLPEALKIEVFNHLGAFPAPPSRRLYLALSCFLI